MNGGNEFDISPDGQYLAYFRGDGGSPDICRTKIGSPPQCAPADPGEVGRDGISLSDSGVVVYTGATGEGCFFKDMAHFAKKQLPGYSGREACGNLFLGTWHGNPCAHCRFGAIPSIDYP